MTNTDTVRLLNRASDELNVRGTRYTKDATGAFNAPREVADIVVALARTTKGAGQSARRRAL